MKKKGGERENCWNVGRGELRGNEREVWDGESKRGQQMSRIWIVAEMRGLGGEEEN